MAHKCAKLIILAVFVSAMLFLVTESHPAPDPRADPGYSGYTWYYGYYNDYKQYYSYKNGNKYGQKYGSYYGYY